MANTWLISKYFTEKEINPRNYPLTEELKQNLQLLIAKMDVIRATLGRPVIVTSCLRSQANQNAINPDAPKSAHVEGLAMDFIVKDMTVDEVLDIIQPLCYISGFALENNGSIERIKKNGGNVAEPRNWVHLQVRPLLRPPIWRIFNP